MGGRAGAGARCGCCVPSFSSHSQLSDRPSGGEHGAAAALLLCGRVARAAEPLPRLARVVPCKQWTGSSLGAKACVGLLEAESYRERVREVLAGEASEGRAPHSWTCGEGARGADARRGRGRAHLQVPRLEQRPSKHAPQSVLIKQLSSHQLIGSSSAQFKEGGCWMLAEEGMLTVPRPLTSLGRDEPR